MLKLDEKKVELEELRVYRNFALTSLLAIIGFVVIKLIDIHLWVLVLSFVAIIILGIGVFLLQKKIVKLIKEIGRL